MKECSYCGHQNDAAAMWCYECGSPLVAKEPEPEKAAAPKTVLEPRETEPGETLFGTMPRKQGKVILLKCRTPEEAYSLAEVLQQFDIVTLLPASDVIQQECEKNGCVEVQVSARAYESIPNLQSLVESQHGKVRADQPLRSLEKAFGMWCGAFFLPGLLLFAWVFEDYRANGYKRRAREFKLWFGMGLASWLVIIVVSAAAIECGERFLGLNFSGNPSRAGEAVPPEGVEHGGASISPIPF